jgi:hypothetical protein
MPMVDMPDEKGNWQPELDKSAFIEGRHCFQNEFPGLSAWADRNGLSGRSPIPCFDSILCNK